MTYTKQADIYLGDVSSQVYEFMLKPRPCIFFNPENINYKNIRSLTDLDDYEDEYNF